jgi:hypothetical protein
MTAPHDPVILALHAVAEAARTADVAGDQRPRLTPQLLADRAGALSAALVALSTVARRLAEQSQSLRPAELYSDDDESAGTHVRLAQSMLNAMASQLEDADHAAEQAHATLARLGIREPLDG